MAKRLHIMKKDIYSGSFYIRIYGIWPVISKINIEFLNPLYRKTLIYFSKKEFHFVRVYHVLHWELIYLHVFCYSVCFMKL